MSQKQQQADEVKKQILLSADTIHASTPSMGLQPRPPTISKAENLRGKNQREHVARELTPREGSSKSPPRGKVGAALIATMLMLIIMTVTMGCAGLYRCRCGETFCCKSDRGGGY